MNHITRKLYLGLFLLFSLPIIIIGQAPQQQQINLSQEEIAEIQQRVLATLSEKEQERYRAIVTMAQQTGTVSNNNDLQFAMAVDQKFKAAINHVLHAKKLNHKNRIQRFKAQPVGEKPYTEKDKDFVDVLQALIDLDQEKAARYKNHENLLTVVACDKDEYNIESTGKSPYNSHIIAWDGTAWNLRKSGKDIYGAQTEPENELSVQMKPSDINPDMYEITISGNLIHDADTYSNPAHSKLSQTLYKKIGKSTDKITDQDITIQGSIEGKQYKGWVASCSDVEATIICPKKTMAYLIQQSSYAKAPADKKAAKMADKQ